MLKYRYVVYALVIGSISFCLWRGIGKYPENAGTKDSEVMTTAFAEPASRSNDVQLLARCVNGEARGESYIGQVAVAAVILNRVDHPSFPNTMAGVIYQPQAFTAVSDGQINVPIDGKSQVVKACRDAMNGYDPTGGAIYYYNPAKTTNKWIFSRQVITTIGKHIFAK